MCVLGLGWDVSIFIYVSVCQTKSLGKATLQVTHKALLNTNSSVNIILSINFYVKLS